MLSAAERAPLVADAAPRRATPRAGYLAVACLALGVATYSRMPAHREASARFAADRAADKFPRPPDGKSGKDASVGASAFINVGMDAFLAFPAVVDWLKEQGIDDPVNSSATVEGHGKLLAYLPARLTIEFDSSAIAGSLGRVASTGYVAYSLYRGTTASWTIIMSTDGALQMISPGKNVNSQGISHFCALKNKDEDTLLLVSSLNSSAAGFAFLWDWRTGEYTRIGGSQIWGTHDAQWAAHNTHDAFWVAQASEKLSDSCAYDTNLTLVTAKDGEILQKLVVPGRSAARHVCSSCVAHAQNSF